MSYRQRSATGGFDSHQGSFTVNQEWDVVQAQRVTAVQRSRIDSPTIPREHVQGSLSVYHKAACSPPGSGSRPTKRQCASPHHNWTYRASKRLPVTRSLPSCECMVPLSLPVLFVLSLGVQFEDNFHAHRLPKTRPASPLLSIRTDARIRFPIQREVESRGHQSGLALVF